MSLQPVVSIASGQVRGVPLEAGGAAFRNIPYAASPIGPRRFRPPAPPAPWTGVRDATSYGPTAPKSPYGAPFDLLLPEPNIPGEDYLNLNVWTPGPAGSAPVMVWVHGGAFANGSGAVPGYDGTAFARDGVVLVTLNYRLGAEGFLHTDDEGAVPNLGLLDQVAALGWVRDNIAAFGGDPRRVTVFGQSAGAMSIGALLAMPSAAGLFHRAILQSGAAHHAITPASALLITRRLAAILDVAPTREALGRVPQSQLLAAQQQLRTEVTANPDPARWGEVAANLMPFEPVVDGTVLPRHPAAAVTDGQTPDIDILVGTNSDEFRLFTVPTGMFDLITEPLARAVAAGYGLDPETALAVYRAGHPDDGFAGLHHRLVTDWFYRIPALRVAEAYAGRRPGSAFVYEFAWQPPTFNGRLGACHAAELPFVFDTLDEKGLAGLISPAPPAELARAMHSAWVAFAATGNPGWPAYSANRTAEAASRATMIFDVPSAVVSDPRPAERELWQDARR
jgi:para-nitrobenzyl esterase